MNTGVCRSTRKILKREAIFNLNVPLCYCCLISKKERKIENEHSIKVKFNGKVGKYLIITLFFVDT